MIAWLRSVWVWWTETPPPLHQPAVPVGRRTEVACVRCQKVIQHGVPPTQYAYCMDCIAGDDWDKSA